MAPRESARVDGPVGAPVKRVEDARLLRGAGQYIGDMRLPGQVEAAFLRSPHAHARLLRVDARPALDCLGMAAVMAGSDVADALFRPYLGLPGFKACEMPSLATDKVRFVGQAVAVVAAESRYLAEDALDAIEVEYEPLPAVVDARRAVEPDAPILHEQWGDNVHVETAFERGDVEGALKRADFTIARHFRTGRYAGMPMETRAVLASYQPITGELTVWSSTQVPHLLRTALADALSFPEHLLRVIAPDVGGGFGTKAVIYTEDIAIALLSTKLGRPVRWIEDRQEHIESAAHARQQDLFVEVAANQDGELLALRFDLVGDAGAYSTYPFTSAIETLQTARHLPGPYTFQNYAQRTRAVVTNKSPIGPCRAVSRPVGNLVVETMMDLIAEQAGLDPADVRRRNLVQPGQFPFLSVSSQTYDSGSYVEALDRALEAIDYRGFREEQRRALAEGRHLGVGISSFVEQTAQGSESFNNRGMENLAGYDSATVRIDPSGKVLVGVGVSDHGQGHHTTLAQLAAGELGVAFEDVMVVHGDTARTPYGMGTFSSRSAVDGGGAVVMASRKLREKVAAIAAHLLEVSPEDVEIVDGQARAKGVPARSVSLRDVARVAYFNVRRLPEGLEPELAASGHYDAGPGTYSNGVHAATVEVDPETGEFRYLRYVVVEDCGTVINPLVVEGQVHGGVAQGVAGAAYEELIYDEDGQLLTTSFMDYLVPTAMEVPHLDVDHLVTPSPFTPLGIKGMGEGGTVSPGAVLACAVSDALRPFGVRFTELPITPARIVAAVRQARAGTAR